MIFYNGSSGGLGTYFAAAAKSKLFETRALFTRLERFSELPAELDLSLKGARAKPESEVALVQLAAMVSVPACEANPELARKLNVKDTAGYVESFIQWARKNALKPKIIYVSSGHVYKAASPGYDLSETDTTEPRSVYAKTKLEAEYELRALASSKTVPLIVCRVFGLIAPSQPSHYVLPSLIARVRERRLSRIPGLSNVRDYLDARDVCNGLCLLTQVAPQSDLIVNLCSERRASIRDLLFEVLDQEGASELKTQVSEAPGRPDDIPYIVGRRQLFDRLTKGEFKFRTLSDTVRDALKSSQ